MIQSSCLVLGHKISANISGRLNESIEVFPNSDPHQIRQPVFKMADNSIQVIKFHVTA